MEYEFVHTVHGPAIVGDGEVIFFHQIAQMVDYAVSDEEFFDKARAFLKERIETLSEMAIKSMTEAVAGLDQIWSMGQYMQGIEQLHMLKDELNALSQGFPGDNPQF